MKKYLTGILAIILAVSLSAFTTTGTSKKTLYYWFPLNASTGVAQSVTTLMHQSNDPQGCDELHSSNPFCEGAYNSFSGSGPYTASGSRIIEDHRLTP